MKTVIIDQSGNEIDSFDTDSFTDKIYTKQVGKIAESYTVKYTQLYRQHCKTHSATQRNVYVELSLVGDIA